MSKKERVIYYSDELNDDFAGNNIKTKQVGKDFKYIHRSPFFRVFEFILYYVIAAPIVWLIQKIYTRQKFVNRKVFRKAKKDGYFIYSNHTQYMNDAYIGALASFPKKCFVIANPDATSIRGIKTLVQALGVIPLGSTLNETRKMVECIETRIKDKNSIIIYPEAHIWPYYTKIRPFEYKSFKFPIKLNKPIFTLTNCYQKRKFSNKPKVITYVDGPFYPNENLSATDATAIELRNIAYDTMVKRTSEYSNYEYIKYVKKEN